MFRVSSQLHAVAEISHYVPYDTYDTYESSYSMYISVSFNQF